MFRSSTILGDLVQSLANVKLTLKHSVKLRRCILCGDVAASPHNIQRRNFAEYFNRSVTLAKLCTSSPRVVENRNM